MADVADEHGGEERGEGGTPALEWIAGGIGLVLFAGIIGFLGWEAVRDSDDRPPEVAVSVAEVRPSGGGFVATVVATNASPRTAASVGIEGVLRRGGQEVETAEATLDYVPGHSEARGGLFFTEDPREGELELRALGYDKP